MVCPEGKPNSTGPEKSAKNSEMTSRTVTPPPGSSHLTIWPNTTAEVSASRPPCFSCVSNRRMRYGRAAPSSRKSS